MPAITAKKEAGEGKPLRVYCVTSSCSGMIVKTFMAPNLCKHDTQRGGAGYRMLSCLVMYLRRHQGLNRTKV